MSALQDSLLKVDAGGEPYLEVGSVKARVVDQAAAELVDYVICGPVSYFPDDIHTTCMVCQAPVVHRPHAPAAPPKICIDCFVRQRKET